MLRWYPSVLLRVVLELTYVPIAFLSIFAVKALVDPDTPWSIGAWQGPGRSEDFWKIAALLLLGWTVLVLGWRGAKSVFKLLIVTWHGALSAAALIHVAVSDDFSVRGEAIGFSMSLGVLAPALSLAALVCSLVWVARDSRVSAATRSVSPLQRRNKVAMVYAGVLLIVSGVAFALEYGELGVIVCLAATVAVHEAMRPLNPSAELHKALVGEGSALE